MHFLAWSRLSTVVCTGWPGWMSDVLVWQEKEKWSTAGQGLARKREREGGFLGFLNFFFFSFYFLLIKKMFSFQTLSCRYLFIMNSLFLYVCFLFLHSLVFGLLLSYASWRRGRFLYTGRAFDRMDVRTTPTLLCLLHLSPYRCFHGARLFLKYYKIRRHEQSQRKPSSFFLSHKSTGESHTWLMPCECATDKRITRGLAVFDAYGTSDDFCCHG